MAAGLYGVPALQEPDTCHEGVEKIGDECIGVDGAGYDFGTPEISAVAKAISEENKSIADEPHVTVAMMLPLQSDTEGLRRQMRSDLQGAYLGQRQANSDKGNEPKIRLVLANPGQNYGHQDKIVSTLLDMAESDQDKLRAVTGFNLSLDATEAAVARLTANGVPVLASRITGDQIANVEGEKPRFPGLARIIPTNGEAAQALADFNAEKGWKNEKTVLVYDTRPDAYNESLASAFRGIEETGPAGPADMPFESPGIDEAGSTGSQFQQITNNICGSKANTVYFAGRALHLQIFALTLAKQTCADRHFTLVSGSDAASLLQTMSEEDWAQLRKEKDEAKVTVQYAAPAHPDAWGTEKEQYLEEPKEALKALNRLITATSKAGTDLGSTPNLEDSRTMLVYDGLVTIGTALRAVQGTDEQVPSLADVRRQWPMLQSTQRVKGTSGLICLTSVGNPYNKPVAVVNLKPSEGKGGTLEFDDLGWPTGKEQPENCVIPSGTS
ncbi:amino acid ABC transporter substrate-binding protein [Streptomyces sp. NPDC056716]|uniref:amino acid ABC transporter substrate-binding protein n=1 Tax=unclassified Streptomyces TaxID=2593676 RepID=UPI003697C65D